MANLSKSGHSSIVEINRFNITTSVKSSLLDNIWLSSTYIIILKWLTVTSVRSLRKYFLMQMDSSPK